MTAAPAVAMRVTGDLAEVTFASYDLDAYGLFLRCKGLPESKLEYAWETDSYRLTTPARFAGMLGIQAAPEPVARLPLPDHLFDYQAFVVERALDARRWAAWLDTGLGKSIVMFEWIRQVMHLTGGRVLVLVPTNELLQQHRTDIRTFYSDLELEHIKTREALIEWCKQPGPAAGICTYAKLIDGVLPELRYLAGIAPDESSILKSGGGVIKWNLIKSARGIEYKLSLTATPAPNETMEYASQASFLEKLRTAEDILWTFFSRDKHGNWRVKPHARKAFYEFMATWSIYIRNPATFGWRDILATLPEPELHEYELEMTDTQRELMYGFLVKKNRGMLTDDRLGLQERSKLSQLAKGFLYDGKKQAARIDSPKPAFVADLVRADVADGRQVLVWTVFDAESDIIAEHLQDLAGVAALHGKMSDTERGETLARFRSGDVRVLISKPQLLGYGLNLQFCTSMVFSGIDDSFERMYQSIRRCMRLGQTESVRVHVPYIPELEGLMLSNVRRKERQFMEDAAIQEKFYREALAATFEHGGQGVATH